MKELEPVREEKISASLTGDAYANRLLCLSLDIGEKILKNGGEIHRVENTIERICRAYGAVHVEVFVIPNLIVASVRMRDDGYSSQSRRVYYAENHLANLEKYNSLSREICASTPPLRELDERIKRERSAKRTPFWVTMLGYATVSSSFAVFFGGSLRDGLAGALVALVLALVGRIRSEYINQMAKTLLTSLLAGFLAYFSVLIGVGEHVDMIMIGTIMLLVPGISFGNALRDLLCGDTVAGMLKTVQACLLAVMIALGYVVSILLLDDKIVSSAEYVAVPAVLHWGVVLLSTVGFCIFFHTRPGRIPIIGVFGMLNYAVYSLALYLGAPLFVAALCSGVFFSVCSELLARALRAPSTVFLLTVPIAIIPGGSLYYTMNALILGEELALRSNASQTLSVSFGIAAGIVAVSVLMQVLSRVFAKEKRTRS